MEEVKIMGSCEFKKVIGLKYSSVLALSFESTARNLQ